MVGEETAIGGDSREDLGVDEKEQEDSTDGRDGVEFFVPARSRLGHF